MSSHILLATMTGIALSTPAWAHDPAEAPTDTGIEAILLDPAENIEAILLDPAEAPIDTELKILWLENIEALLRQNTAAVRSGLGGQAAARTGPQSRNTGRHRRTQTLPRIRTLRRLPAELGLEAAPGIARAGRHRALEVAQLGLHVCLNRAGKHRSEFHARLLYSRRRVAGSASCVAPTTSGAVFALTSAGLLV